MTAALILATIGRPYRFNYVGGEQRNKTGLGTVIDGCEKMFAEMNPLVGLCRGGAPPGRHALQPPLQTIFDFPVLP